MSDIIIRALEEVEDIRKTHTKEIESGKDIPDLFVGKEDLRLHRTRRSSRPRSCRVRSGSKIQHTLPSASIAIFSDLMR